MSPTTSSYHSSSVILSLLVLVLMLLSGCHSQIDCNARENVRACIDKLNMVNFQNHDDSRPNCVNTLGMQATVTCTMYILLYMHVHVQCPLNVHIHAMFMQE